MNRYMLCYEFIRKIMMSENKEFFIKQDTSYNIFAYCDKFF